MKYALEKVSRDVETNEHVLLLRQVDGEDRIALNLRAREAQVLETLLAPGGLPAQEVLDHLRDAATRSTGKGHVVGIHLLLSGERSFSHPGLTPVLIVRRDGSPLEQAVPASLAHAAAWSLSLGLPFEVPEGILSYLQATVTVIPGVVPTGFRALLADLDEIDAL